MSLLLGMMIGSAMSEDTSYSTVETIVEEKMALGMPLFIEVTRITRGYNNEPLIVKGKTLLDIRTVHRIDEHTIEVEEKIDRRNVKKYTERFTKLLYNNKSSIEVKETYDEIKAMLK